MLEGEVLRVPSQALLPRWFLCTGRTETTGFYWEGDQIRSQTSQVPVPPPQSDPEQLQTSLASIASSVSGSNLWCFNCLRATKACNLEIQPFYHHDFSGDQHERQRPRKAGELRCRIVKLSDPSHPGQKVKCFILNFKAWSTMVSCFSLRYNFEQGLCPGNWVATCIIKFTLQRKSCGIFF